MNRWLGWAEAVRREVWSLLPRDGRVVTVLDIATGSGDVPRAMLRRATRDGITMRAVGSDVSAAVLRDARRVVGDTVSLVRHDATALPFADHSLDVATLCLAAHHLDFAALRDTIVEMARVSRRGVVVSDLERGVLAYIGARLMALILRNPLTSHDGPISVLRAYTVAELCGVARAAGLQQLRVRRRFPFRMTLTARVDRATMGRT